MKYTLHIVPASEKQFLKLPTVVQYRIEKKLLLLENNPRSQGVQKLHGTQFYRVRVGDYRIIYAIDDERKMVKILDIGHRREVYRGW